MSAGQGGDGVLFERRAGSLTGKCLAGRGSDLLVVVFSQVRVPEGKYGLERLFARTTHPCLFINQPDNAWYRQAEDDIDALIAAAQVRTGAARLVFYGSSMGGFGAAATAARWPAARAYVFAPDFAIGEPGSQSAEAGLEARAGEVDLSTHIGGVRQGRIEVIIGLFDGYDGGVGARLAAAALPSTVRLTPLASSHELHDHLYSLNIIRKLVATFERDFGRECAARGLLVADPDWAAAVAFAAALAALERGAADVGARLAQLKTELRDGPINPGIVFLKADALERAGALAAAEDLLANLDQAVAADPRLAGLPKRYLKAVPRRRIALLQRLGRQGEAAALARVAQAAYPSDDGFAALSEGKAAPDLIG